jgi:hypothetical protein
MTVDLELKQAFHQAIEQVNGAIDKVIEAAKAAGLSDRYIDNVLRTKLRSRHYAEKVVRKTSPLDDFIRKYGSVRPQDPDEFKRRQVEAEQRLQARQAELKRLADIDAERKLMREMVNAGYKAMAMKHHPDRGGSKDEMTRLNRARDRLKVRAS